jgi:succinate dehydrogenase / fumarate reductase cytochrome b subunit
MALTGLMWSGFVLMHMLGNLLLFVGADAYNAYSHALVSNPLIFGAEALLVLTLLVHVFDGVTLTVQNRKARPVKYEQSANGSKSPRFQSKWMIFHGTLLLAFIILHLAHFKFGPGLADGYVATVNGSSSRDIYRLVVETFKAPGYLAWYCVAMVFVGLHLSHGFYSAFCSLGIFNAEFAPILNRIGYVYAAIVALGFIAPPVYVFFAL